MKRYPVKLTDLFLTDFGVILTVRALCGESALGRKQSSGFEILSRASFVRCHQADVRSCTCDIISVMTCVQDVKATVLRSKIKGEKNWFSRTNYSFLVNFLTGSRESWVIFLKTCHCTCVLISFQLRTYNVPFSCRLIRPTCLIMAVQNLFLPSRDRAFWKCMKNNALLHCCRRVDGLLNDRSKRWKLGKRISVADIEIFGEKRFWGMHASIFRSQPVPLYSNKKLKVCVLTSKQLTHPHRRKRWWPELLNSI